MHDSDDGYLRIEAPQGGITRETSSTGAALSLLFVDMVLDANPIDRIANSLQSANCGHASVILFRWNEVALPSSDLAAFESKVVEWLSQLAQHAVISRHLQPHWVGVIAHVIGTVPLAKWVCRGANDALIDHPNSTLLVDRALRTEISALFEWGHAIWRPSNYHYELPSGDHSASFIKVADAFRTPRDADVCGFWLADRLAEDQVVITDNASLIPLVMALRNLSSQADWRVPASITLEDYPATRFSVFNALKSARSLASTALILLSVNASGRHLSLIEDAAYSILRPGNVKYNIVVIADKNIPWSHFYRSPDKTTSSWLGMADHIPNSLDSSSCSICRSSDRSQIVKIDPRSFEALALPGANLIMPDVNAALAAKDFWTLCYRAGALGVLSLPDESPSIEARGKGEFMNVRVSTRKLLQYLRSDDDLLRGRMTKLIENKQLRPTDFDTIDSIVVSKYERELEGFDNVLQVVLGSLGCIGKPLIELDVQMPIEKFPDDTRRKIGSTLNPLILSIGSVSGWNMRQMLVAVQQCWTELSIEGTVTGLVLHSRPSSDRQWKNLFASYSKKLYFIWQTFIPIASPLDDERKVLATITTDSVALGPRNFLRGRRRFCSPPAGLHRWDVRIAAFEDGQSVPDPRMVLWGLSPIGSPMTVRNESLYGTRVDALTAYVAVGAAMQAKREQMKNTDPRWPMFDFDSISRSYFDGILVASMLRWANPSECWWGESSHSRNQAVQSLLARTRDSNDQQVLYPELLLAAYQGKIPREAVSDAIARIRSDVESWDEAIDRSPVELAIHVATMKAAVQH